MTYPISFVSLGPGEPELITVKGLRQLQKADIIYCPPPATGKVKSSRVPPISYVHWNKRNCHPLLHAPHEQRPHGSLESLRRPLQRSRRKLCGRRQIVIVAEGDAGFYSSIQYIYDKFIETGIDVQRIAGIPAFIAAGALAGLHIVKQEEQIVVIPGTPSAEELSEKINAGYVIVIMKLSQCVEAVHACIRKHPQTQFHYFENVGTDKEYYTSDRQIIAEKSFPYFSLMIIQ